MSLTRVTLNGTTYWLHVGECVWVRESDGQVIRDLELSNKLFKEL